MSLPTPSRAVLAPQEPDCFGLLPGGLQVRGPLPSLLRLHSLPSACSLHPRGELSFQYHGERAEEGPRCCRAAALSGCRPVLGSCPLESRTPQPPRLPCSLTARAGTLLPTARLRPPGPWSAPTWRSTKPSEPLQGSAYSARRFLLLFQLPPPPRATPPGELGPLLLPRAAAGGALQSRP